MKNSRGVFFLLEAKFVLICNKWRSMLMVCTAIILSCTMSIYLDNLISGQEALENVYKNLPVMVNVVNSTGEKSTHINITPKRVDTLDSLSVTNTVCSTNGAGAYTSEAKKQEPFQGGDCSILAVNCLAAAGIAENEIEFADSYNIGFFENAQALCVVNSDFASRYDLSLTDSLPLDTYLTVFNSFGESYKKLGACDLKIVGIYTGLLRCDVIVPISWLKKQAEDATVDFVYSSYQTQLSDPANIRLFKQALRDCGLFLEVDKDSSDMYSGDTLSIRDEVFYETESRLRKNLTVFKGFLIPFLLVVIALIVLITFLILRTDRQNIAISLSLGCSKSDMIWTRLFSFMVLSVIGSLLAIPIMIGLGGGSTQAVILIAMSYVACSAIGVFTATLMVLRFDVMKMLIKED